jgi:hypothetical protein
MNHPQDKMATASEIIASIISSMRLGIEDLHTRRLAPGIFRVYLHSTDYVRLEGIFEELQEDSFRALDQSLDSLNRSVGRGWIGSLSHWLQERWSRLTSTPAIETVRPVIKPERGWQISFHTLKDPAGQPGEVVIDTILSASSQPDSEEGARVRRTLHRLHNPEGLKAPGVPTKPPTGRLISRSGEGHSRPLWTGRQVDDLPVLAWISFQGAVGRRSYAMSKKLMVAGRGGRGVRTDLELPPLPGISREHFRIRVEEGVFSIQDLSSFGTMVDGYPIPATLATGTHESDETDLWVVLPRHCLISVAGVLSLEFIAAEE